MPQRTSFLEGLRRLVQILIEGYATLNRRLWVLVIPIGLDLFLWLGPRLAPQHLAEALAAGVRWTASPPQSSTDLAAALSQWAHQANLSGLIAGWLIPALVPRLSLPPQPGFAPPLGWLLPLTLVGVALALLLWTLYLVPMADLVRGSNESGRAMLRRVPRVWWRMSQLVGLAAAAGLVLLVGAGALILVAAMIVPAMGLLVQYLSIALGLWLVFCLHLSPWAIVVSAVSPRRAIGYSMQIVRSSLGWNVGFVVLAYIVRTGTVALWQRLAGPAWVVALGILVNGYVASGLVMAGLIFYRERLQAWLSAQTGQKRGGVVS